MAGPTTNRTVNIYINDSAAQTKLANLRNTQEKLTNAIQKGEAAGKDMTASIAKLGDTKGRIQQLEGILSGKLAPSLNMVKARAMELRAELNRMSSSDSGFENKKKEYEAVNAQWQKMQGSIGRLGATMHTAREASNSFWRDAGKVAIGTLVANTTQGILQAVGGYISGIVSGNAKLSDSLADVRKATGLTETGVASLNSELGRIDTRTATSDLRDIAIGLGQIGQAATKESVAAIDQIVVALGDEFGGGAKEITTTLGTLRNNLQDIKSNNYGADVLAIGNALNTLGAEGLATAPVVVDFANRLAGVAGTFKVTSGQILGLSATMQELGINVERGSTATIKIFQKLAAEPEKFARVAGISVDKFINLINTDMLSAFNAVAVGAGKASGKNTEFAKVLKELDADGSGAGEVLSKLSRNQELLANKTSLASRALKETSSITDEFSTKNNNLAANLAKLSKNISSIFTNSSLSSGINNIVAGLTKMTEKTKTSTEKFDEQLNSVANLKINIEPLLTRYDELAKKANKSAEENSEMSSIIKKVTDIMPGATTAFDKYGNAIAISTERIKDFIRNESSILKIENKTVIDAYTKQLVQLEKQLAVLKLRNKEIEKTGTFQVQRKDDMGRTYFRNANAEEIKLQVANYKLISDEVNGYKAAIARKNGDELAERIQQDEIARKVKFGLTDNPYLKGLPENPPPPPPSGDAASTKRLKETIKKEKALTNDYYEWFKKTVVVGNVDWTLIYEDRLDAAQRAYNEERNIILKNYADGLIDKKSYNDQLNLLSEQQLQEEILIAENAAPISEKARKDYEAKKTRQLEIAAAKRDAIGNAEVKQDIAQYDAWVSKVEERTSQYTQYAQQVLNGAGALLSEQNNRENAELQRDQARNDKKKANLDKQLAGKRISQKKYNKEVEAMDAAYDAKRKALAAKQFDREKALAIVSATIQGAQASVAALKAGPVLGPIMAGIIGGMALAQIAIIAGSKPPEFEQGGILPGKGGMATGARHTQGGISLINADGQKVGAVEGGEPILSRSTYANNKPVIDALLESSMNNGGRKINLPWLYTQTKSINTNKAVAAMQYNSSFSNKSASSGNNNNEFLSPTALDVMNRWIAQMEKGVKASVYHNEWEQKNTEKEDLKKLGSSNPNGF